MSSSQNERQGPRYHHHRPSQVPRPTQSRQFRTPESVWGDWSEYKSKNGRSYYYNKVTKENKWEKPDGWDPRGNGHQNGHIPNRHHHHHHRPNTQLADIIKSNLVELKKKSEKVTKNEMDEKPKARPPPKKRPLPTNPIIGNHHAQSTFNQSSIVGNSGESNNGYQIHQHHPIVKRPTRAEEFKRVIDEIPKLPEYPDFEALRPLTDNNLISDDVRKLTNEPNEKQILDIIPSKTKLHHKLALNSTKLKNLRANVRRCQVMRSYLDDRLSNYRSEMKILIEGGNAAQQNQSHDNSSTATATSSSVTSTTISNMKPNTL